MSAADACLKLVRQRQSERRLPSVSAAVFRGGDRVWYGAAGHSRLDPREEPTADTQYRIGSITKTFTAVLVLQLRDAGALDLDDRLTQHLPEAKHDATIRRLLSHLSGWQREPAGDVWESLVPPTREELFGNLAATEPVSTPNRRWHYSNLAYALLGELVARHTNATWEEVLADRLLTPLGMARTTQSPEPPYAQGYYVDPYADRAAEEPVFVLGGVASAAQLWSTPDDLAKWGAFLIEPDPAILAPATLDEMTAPHSIADEHAWTIGWGLGLMLFRKHDRICLGHTGGMPGHLAVLAVSRKDGVGAVAFSNNSAGFDPGAFGNDLVNEWLANDPGPATPWAPGPDVPPDIEPLLGRWWAEGSEWVFVWREGRFQGAPAGAPPTFPPSVFEADGDSFRTVSGMEAGERLRVVRAPDGSVTKLYWATYPLTRHPATFGSTK